MSLLHSTKGKGYSRGELPGRLVSWLKSSTKEMTSHITHYLIWVMCNTGVPRLHPAERRGLWDPLLVSELQKY